MSTNQERSSVPAPSQRTITARRAIGFKGGVITPPVPSSDGSRMGIGFFKERIAGPKPQMSPETVKAILFLRKSAGLEGQGAAAPKRTVVKGFRR